MLVEFRVTNFKSFKEEQTLSMVASSDTSMQENTVVTEALGKHRLLRSAVVYGANASGKTNLVDAFRFVRDFVRSSVELKPDSGIPAKPFLLDKHTAESTSHFELTFVHNGVRYQYGFSVDGERVHKEYLVAYPKGRAQTWFERPIDGWEATENWHFGPNLRGEKKRLVRLLQSNWLFLSLAAKFANKQLTEVHEWFSEKLRTIGMGPLDNIERFTAKLANENDEFRTSLVGFLREADLAISDVSVKAKRFEETKAFESMSEMFSDELLSELRDQEHFEIQMQHQTQDPADSGVPFSINDESRGTRRFFAISGPWIYALNAGCTLVVDELHSSLHPILVRALIQLFHSPEANRTGAQLVFNTHDTTQLDSALFRRDQIWFVEKDSAGASHLYPLLDYRPRKDEALGRGYLQGRYGAIPFLGNLEGFVPSGEA